MGSMMKQQFVLVGALAFAAGCGIEVENPPQQEVAGASRNARFGFDTGAQPTSALSDWTVAGGWVAGKSVAFVAFTAPADVAANDADGAGTALDPEAPADTNSARDVFVAAVTAEDIDPNAFTQSLAGTFRNPRCATCHSMNAAPSTGSPDEFVSIDFTTHPGNPQGNLLNDPGGSSIDLALCTMCHEVPEWRAPGPERGPAARVEAPARRRLPGPAPEM